MMKKNLPVIATILCLFSFCGCEAMKAIPNSGDTDEKFHALIEDIREFAQYDEQMQALLGTDQPVPRISEIACKTPYLLTYEDCGYDSAFRGMDGVTLTSFDLYCYDAAGNLIQEERYYKQADECQFRREYVNVLEYEDGRPGSVLTFWQTGADAAPKPWEFMHFEYHADTYTCTEETNRFGEHRVTTWDYDYKGNPIKEQVTVNGKLKHNYEYTYEEGELKSMTYFTIPLLDNGKPPLVYTERYIQSDDGCSTVKICDCDGDYYCMNIHTYNDTAYRTDGYFFRTIAREFIPQELLDPSLPETKEHLYHGYTAFYDERGRLQEEYSRETSGLHTTDNIYSLFSWDASGELDFKVLYYPYNKVGRLYEYIRDSEGNCLAEFIYDIKTDLFSCTLSDGSSLTIASDLSGADYDTYIGHTAQDGALLNSLTFREGRPMTQNFGDQSIDWDISLAQEEWEYE